MNFIEKDVVFIGFKNNDNDSYKVNITIIENRWEKYKFIEYFYKDITKHSVSLNTVKRIEDIKQLLDEYKHFKFYTNDIVKLKEYLNYLEVYGKKFNYEVNEHIANNLDFKEKYKEITDNLKQGLTIKNKY